MPAPPVLPSPREALEVAALLHSEGRSAQALAVLQEAIDGLTTTDPPDAAMLAILHFQAADTLRVLRRFEQALATLEESGRWLGECLAGLDTTTPEGESLASWAAQVRCTFPGLRGWIEQDWGALDAAEASFARERRELELLASRGIDVGRIRADGDRHLANLAMQTGNPERVEELLAEYEDRALDPTLRAYLCLRWAGAVRERSLREGREPGEARAALELALEEPELEPIDRILGELWLADHELDHGQEARARELWVAAGERLERLASGGSRAERRWVGVGARLAATVEEQVRWRTRLEVEIEAFLAEWRALDAREGGYGLFHLDDALTLFCEHARLALALDGAELGARVALENFGRAHAETSLARRLDAAPPLLEDLRAALCARPGQGLLVYLMGPARSWLFALDATALEVHPLPSFYALERPRRRLVQELLAHVGRPTEPGRTAARELAEALLPQEMRARFGSWDSVSVCGLDVLLGDLPFELLDLGRGQALGTEIAVWNLPPLAAAVALARRAAAQQPLEPGLRLVAAPTLAAETEESADVGALELTPEEQDRLLASFPADLSDVRLGAEASATALAGPRPPFLHVVAHGTYDRERAYSAEILLAPSQPGDDGRVSAADLERLWSAGDAPPLVLLAACRASRSAQRRGDAGAASLATTFLALGSHTVVASPYDLDLDVACRLGAAFHAGLARGADAAEALRAAREELAADTAFAPSLQPLLVRAIGFAPAPFEPWSPDEVESSWPGSPALLGAGGAGLLALLWRRHRGRSRPTAGSPPR